MTPVSREEMYLYKLAGGSVTVPTPVSRKEMYLAKACGETVTVPDPVSREEMYLYKLAGGAITLPTPVNRLELLMAAACGEAVVPYDPVSRLEWFWAQLSSSMQTITGVPPITFTSDGTLLSSWSIYGNGQQTGTPTPDDPITPDFVGTLSGSDWTIPITCAGNTVSVNLGQVQTVRKIRKFVLTGEESITLYTVSTGNLFRIDLPTLRVLEQFADAGLCTHYRAVVRAADRVNGTISGGNVAAVQGVVDIVDDYATVEDFKAYLAQQYADGTPVTIWYVLATPTMGIVNAPLCKIGDYADELHSSAAGVTIQTVSGSNTLTIGTDMQPSSVSITGHISQ